MEVIIEDERKYHVFVAKLAEKAERYNDIVDSMEKVAILDLELTAEERNLFAVGYKNVIGARRDSWLILSSLEKQEEATGSERSEQHVLWMRKYMKRIEDEISKLCNDALSIIAIHLLPSSATGESLVHYYKLKGDYYRYLAEFRTGNERQEAANQSLRAYQAGTSTAVMNLPSSHPLRLGIALNFSVLYHEIMGFTERACQLAEQAIDEALVEITKQGEDSNQDSVTIMQLIQENLTLWTKDPLEQGGEEFDDIKPEMQIPPK